MPRTGTSLSSRACRNFATSRVARIQRRHRRRRRRLKVRTRTAQRVAVSLHIDSARSHVHVHVRRTILPPLHPPLLRRILTRRRLRSAKRSTLGTANTETSAFAGTSALFLVAARITQPRNTNDDVMAATLPRRHPRSFETSET